MGFARGMIGRLASAGNSYACVCCNAAAPAAIPPPPSLSSSVFRLPSPVSRLPSPVSHLPELRLRRRLPALGAAWLFAVAPLTPLCAQDGVTASASRDSAGTRERPPRMLFARGLALDGLLTEAPWRLADSLTTFTQRDPRQGEPASERTVVRFIGSTEGLWIGMWAYDREPHGIRRTQLRRDADFGADDNISVMLSPTADKRTAFLFSINANGALNDAEVLNFEGESREWDGIWDGRARV